MKSFIYFISITISILFSFNVTANELCSNCSISQMESKARSLGSGEHLIIDVDREVIKKYFVIVDQIGDIPLVYIEETPVPQKDKDTFNKAMDAKNNFEQAIRNYQAEPIDDIVTAWDLSGNTRNQNLVAGKVKSDVSLFDYLAAYSQHLLEMAAKMPNMSYTIYHDFAGGGYAKYEVTGFVNGEMQLRLIGAVDGDLNNVPLTITQFEGKFTLTAGGPNLQGVSNATSAFGGSLIFNGVIQFGSSGGDGGYITVDCVQKSDNVVECTGRRGN
jgi:hypothetical protein